MEKQCLVCNSTFQSTSRYPQWQKYCSRQCTANAWRRKRSGHDLQLKIVNCAVCEKKFQQKSIRHTKYCSKKCLRRGCTRRLRGKEERGEYRGKANRPEGTITNDGYRVITRHGHPNARKNGLIMEHVFVMSEYLKRPIKKGETVHHKNGFRKDNRIENLELWSHSHPFGQRVEDKISWCKEFLSMYDEDYRNYLIEKGNKVS